MKIQLRAAEPQDAKDMAKLLNIAGEGLPESIWTGLTGPNEVALDVGARMALRENVNFSWKNAVMAECEGEIAGMVLAHETSSEPEPMDQEAHPSLRPLTKLENQVPNTKYITAIATYESFRGYGIARKLLSKAEDNPGKNGMSMIMLNRNKAAMEYCVAMGYRDVAQAPVIKLNWETENTTWHLLRKP